MLKEITRNIPRADERELWVRAGGRCQFRGCNNLVYQSLVTRERVNVAEKAHIYSFSPEGPRGHGPFARKIRGLNQVGNLLLVCPGCHKTIDQHQDGEKYSAALLQEWKREHEARIVRVTGVSPKRGSHVLLYDSRIGKQDSPIDPDDATESIFPGRYPTAESPVKLSLCYEHQDHEPTFWETEARHLKNSFERQVAPLMRDSATKHFSLFALGDMPLLVLLGSLLTDKPRVDVYQLHREPATWRWLLRQPRGFAFTLRRPRLSRGVPALVFSLSGRIDHARVTDVLGPKAAIWELTVSDPHNDFLRTRGQLEKFRQAVRKALVAINAVHGIATPLHIFPAMPVACAVELGRVRLPKPDAPWIVYDHHRPSGKFTQALTIGDQHDHTQT